MASDPPASHPFSGSHVFVTVPLLPRYQSVGGGTVVVVVVVVVGDPGTVVVVVVDPPIVVVVVVGEPGQPGCVVVLGFGEVPPGGIVVVEEPARAGPPVSGSQTELLAVYSLVDTILLNVPEMEAVILLWNGRQLLTFAGHLDTSLPLRADSDLIETRK